jgi:hypothetical protein
MRRLWILAMVLVVATPAAAESLLDLTPGRPLVAIHANRLGAFAERLEELPAAQAYLESPAHDHFRDSKLALKLASRAKKMAKLAGQPLTLGTLFAQAKGETVLALYDIGELHFLVITRLPAAEQAKLAFVEKRAAFSERVHAGRTYHARVDYDAGLAFVFYQEGDLLMVASAVNLIEAALAARAGGGDPGLTQEADYLAAQPLVQPRAQEATIWVDMAKLNTDRYFRNYWIWNNRNELAATRAVLGAVACDGSLTERRVLLGPTIKTQAPVLAMPGGPLQSFSAGGAGTADALQAHFGWQLGGEPWDAATSARLLAARPQVEEASGLVGLVRGAALVTELDPAAALAAIAEPLQKKRPALAARLQPDASGEVATLSAGPGLPTVFARRQGALLLIADDEKFLAEMAAEVRAGEATALTWARADSAAARLLVKQLHQADDLRLANGDGGAFLADVMPDMLEAATEFKRTEFTVRPVEGGLLQETIWR